MSLIYLYCSRSVASSRQELIENPPQLSKDVLQQLLADAKKELGSGRTSAVTDDDNEHNGNVNSSRQHLHTFSDKLSTKIVYWCAL